MMGATAVVVATAATAANTGAKATDRQVASHRLEQVRV